MSKQDDLIVTHQDGAITKIVINRPEKRNAMTLDMWRQLSCTLDLLARDQAIRVLIISGAGDKSFCAGNDIKEYATVRATPEQREIYDAVTTLAYERLRTFPKPTIAAIRGYCVGGGLELALLCDLQLAADDAAFGVTPARLGIGYKFDDLELLLAHLAPKHAKELLFTASRFPADDAVRWGLINRAVAASALDDSAQQLAHDIAANAPLTVTSLKRCITEAMKDKPDRTLCAQLVATCDASADRLEGQTAFSEKRPPVFQGK